METNCAVCLVLIVGFLFRVHLFICEKNHLQNTSVFLYALATTRGRNRPTLTLKFVQQVFANLPYNVIERLGFFGCVRSDTFLKTNQSR